MALVDKSFCFKFKSQPIVPNCSKTTFKFAIHEIEPKNLTNSQKIKNAFEILIDAKGDIQSKTPKGKVKRIGQKDKITSKDNNRTLDNWLKKL